jgi:peptidoglycan hydrolase-like protein with peptidoglycan-binding domain
MPLAASAQSTDLQNQIQSLLNQIKALQEQLRALVASSSAAGSGIWMMGSTTPPWGTPPGQIAKAACIRLNRNLDIGSQGDDVKKLQEILAEDSDNDYHAGITGFFGPRTAQAMMRFQMRFNIASSSNGSVGPMTRGFFERACGEGMGDDEKDARSIVGNISSVGSSSFVVTINANTSRTINFTASTTIEIVPSATSSPITGSSADLAVGKVIHAIGTPNADGSLTATLIRIGVPLPPPRPQKPIFEFDKLGRKIVNTVMDDLRGRDNRLPNRPPKPGMMPINGGPNTGRGL